MTRNIFGKRPDRSWRIGPVPIGVAAATVMVLAANGMRRVPR